MVENAGWVVARTTTVYIVRAIVRSQVADNYCTGKANHKTLTQREHKFKDGVAQNNNSTSLKNTTTIANIPAFTKSEDLEVMSFFLLPAEYASVCGTSPWKANAS